MKRLITASAFGVLLSVGAASPVFADGARTEITAVCDVAQPCSAGDAGMVSISRNGAILTITNVATNAGWRIADQRATGLSVEVEFRRGTTKLTFQAEVEDGVVNTRIRTSTR